jgi:hypothetical protein
MSLETGGTMAAIPLVRRAPLVGSPQSRVDDYAS